MAPAPHKPERSYTTEAAKLTKDLPKDLIASNIEHDEHSLSTKLAGLITVGQTQLSTSQAIIENAVTQEAWKMSKDVIQTILAPAKAILPALDIVAQIHPAASVAVNLFKVVVQLELNRLDNDKHIAVLYNSMTGLLFVLSYLDPVFKHDDGLKSALEKQLNDICTNINKFGNFCDIYYKHKSIVRTIMSSKYKGQLETFSKAFADLKTELQFLVQQKTAATVVNMSANVDDVSLKVDKIIAFLEIQSPREREISEMVARQGGEAAVAHDDKALERIASKFGEEINSAMKYTIRTDMQEMLTSNLALFNLKMESAVSQIEDAVDRSTETILVHLDSGPHDLIEDPDIRAVWKDMGWKMSCKVRQFVDAVHHHYAQKFAWARQETGEPHPERWTLKFLSKVIFYPAIGNAIDEDASGYVSVYETNRFFRAKPVTWSAPQWLAFWAAGWYQNTVDYRHRAYSLLDSIEEHAKKTLTQNKDNIKDYLGQEGLGDMRYIIEALYTDNLYWHGEETGTEFDALKKLRIEYMENEIKSMKAHLLKTKYRLDSATAVNAITGTTQIENSIFCVIYLVLKRHIQIIELSQKYVLSDQEFYALYDTVYNIGYAFDVRYHNLKECWRQQRLDVKLQANCFAGGMFEKWHNEYNDMDDSDSDSESESGSESEDDELDRQYDEQEKVAKATDADDPRDPKDLLVYPLPDQPDPSTLTKIEAEKDAEGNDDKSVDGSKKKKGISERISDVEDRLEGMEKLLQEVLALAKTLAPNAASSSASTSTKKEDASSKEPVDEEESGSESGSQSGSESGDE